MNKEKNTKYLLGIQCYASHDSGASILKVDNNFKSLDFVAISEERLIRKKYPYTFPTHSIHYCLEYFGLKNLDKVDFIISDWIRINRWLRSAPSYNYKIFDYIKEKLLFDKKKIIQIDHHLAHAASSYYTSGFNDSSILIVDGNGSDLETNSFYHGKNNKITLIEKSKNHGIGAAYTEVTDKILNLGAGSEGKTMGLAPYGKQNNKIHIPYTLKGINTNFSKFMRKLPYSDVLNQINSNFRPDVLKLKYPKATRSNIMNKIFCDWAYKIQNVTEKVMVHLGKEIYKKTKTNNLCLAGGVALNSVANNILLKKTNFKKMFVFPACSDSGVPFGLVLWGYHNLLQGKKRIKFENAYTGKEYLKNDIKSLLRKNDIEFKETNSKEIANLIKDGNVIGNFHGKSEYGPRALGNRSILGDPRNPKMRDYINNKVKHREIYRPFAPAIMEEFSKEYFDISYSPFMLQVAKSKKSKKIPSAIHVDNTARVQTVNKKQNKNFYSIINEFYKLTKVPVVLNTSFNDAGEPLVESPLDALLCFLKTKIDYLIIENILITKKNLTNIKKNILILDKLRNDKIKKDEKKFIKNLTAKFSLKEYKKKQKKENLKAKNHVLIRPIDKINKFLTVYKKQNKPLLVIGSSDHTNILYKIFKKQIKNVVFLDIKKNDILQNKGNIHNFKVVKKFNIDDYYEKVFISSFEYIDEIVEKYKINYFTPYDNSSRSIIDYYYIKRYSGKNKLHSKNILN